MDVSYRGDARGNKRQSYQGGKYSTKQTQHLHRLQFCCIQNFLFVLKDCLYCRLIAHEIVIQTALCWILNILAIFTDVTCIRHWVQTVQDKKKKQRLLRCLHQARLVNWLTLYYSGYIESADSRYDKDEAAIRRRWLMAILMYNCKFDTHEHIHSWNNIRENYCTSTPIPITVRSGHFIPASNDFGSKFEELLNT